MRNNSIQNSESKLVWRYSGLICHLTVAQQKNIEKEWVEVLAQLWKSNPRADTRTVELWRWAFRTTIMKFENNLASMRTQLVDMNFNAMADLNEKLTSSSYKIRENVQFYEYPLDHMQLSNRYRDTALQLNISLGMDGYRERKRRPSVESRRGSSRTLSNSSDQENRLPSGMKSCALFSTNSLSQAQRVNSQEQPEFPPLSVTSPGGSYIVLSEGLPDLIKPAL